MSGDMTRIRTWQDAETFAVSVLRAWGYPDAKVTAGGADGGVDVRGQHVLAQVKHRSAPTGRPDVQRLYGARGKGTEDLFFFSAAGYSPPAIDYGEVHDVGLFSYTPAGRLAAHTRTARALLPRQAEAEVRLAPGSATNGQTPDTAGAVWFAFTTLAGAALGAYLWTTSEHPRDPEDLAGFVLMCGFFGAMFGAKSGGGENRR